MGNGAAREMWCGEAKRIPFPLLAEQFPGTWPTPQFRQQKNFPLSQPAHSYPPHTQRLSGPTLALASLPSRTSNVIGRPPLPCA